MEVHRAACPAGNLRWYLDRALRVPWYRANAFQQVSVCLILEQLLARGGVSNERIVVRGQVACTRPMLIELATSAVAGAPEAADSVTAGAAAAIGDSGRTGEPLSASMRGFSRGQARSKHLYHLYASQHNPGVEEVARLLEEEERQASVGHATSFRNEQPLVVTHDAMQRSHACAFLLYLNDRTHTKEAGSQRVARLHEELDAALSEGMHIVLVHEQRRGKGAVPFSYFLNEAGNRVTPPQLLQDRAKSRTAPPRKGLYSDLAVPLYDAPFLQTSLRLILLNEGVGRRRRSQRTMRPPPTTAKGKLLAQVDTALARVSGVRQGAGGEWGGDLEDVDDEPIMVKEDKRATLSVSSIRHGLGVSSKSGKGLGDGVVSARIGRVSRGASVGLIPANLVRSQKQRAKVGDLQVVITSDSI